MKYTSPPDPFNYQRLVWELVRLVPPGKVVTYGQIAARIQPPAGIEWHEYRAWSPRWVGGAMANCPDDVPWQRVVNSQGKISLPPEGGGNRQRELLEEEGVIFDERGRVDLKRFGWDWPDEVDAELEGRGA